MCTSIQPSTGVPHHSRKPEVTRTIQNTIEGDNTIRTISWSGPTASLFGFGSEEIENSEVWWLERIHPDDRPTVSSNLSTQLERVLGNPHASESRIWGLDYHFQHKDGHYILVSDRTIVTRDDDGEVVTMVSVVSDKEKRIIERREHAAILNTNDKLAMIANNTPSGIFLMDTQGYTTYMNAAGEWRAVPVDVVCPLTISSQPSKSLALRSTRYMTIRSMRRFTAATGMVILIPYTSAQSFATSKRVQLQRTNPKSLCTKTVIIMVGKHLCMIPTQLTG